MRLVAAVWDWLLRTNLDERVCRLSNQLSEPPCRWKNSNVCVAEGCYGHSCLKEDDE